ncbi:MAG: TetR/AcrR family transcriptional regulator [Longicatena sp.]
MPRNKYPEETVQRILDASLKLFLEKGYEQTSILDIVDQLGGLTRGAFYHHFKSKEEVWDALSDKLFFENNPFELVKKEKNLNGLEKIKKIMSLQDSNSDLSKVNLMGESIAKNPKILANFMETNQTMITPWFEELFREGMEDGSIQKSPYVKQLSELFTFITNMWFVPFLYPCTQEEFLNKFYFVKELMEHLGAPVFDDELLSRMKGMVEQIYKE